MVASIRRGEGPRLLHARTFRLLGHTSTDPAAWRDAAEVEAARAREPIARLEAWLAANGVDRGVLEAIAADAEAEMARARAEALAAPWPAPASAFADVQDVGAVPVPA
jgi:pyruvate dehydrogenase E1 component alpha subunit